MSRVSLDLSGLNDLMAKISTKKKVRVGVLGSGNQREEDEYGNAAIGLVHEFGSNSRGIPPRSFIRMPLEMRKRELGGTIGKMAGEVLQSGRSGDSALEIIGIKAENIIQDAFDTGGFGKWPRLKADTIRQKGSSMPLVDTAQLRRSISSKVKDG